MPRKTKPPEELLAATVSETAEGIPDDAIGPDQASVPELLNLSDEVGARALAAKLQGEVDERRATKRNPFLRKLDGHFQG